jgi:glucose uptake protein
VVLPNSFAAAIVLLIVSLVCLGTWPNLFKLTGKSWRFELFYYDFGVGAILLALAAAYTFGTFGSDLSFSDRMMVAGRTAQAMLAGAGFVFNLSNMLLVASISLVGMATALPLSVGTALIVTSFWNFRAANFFLLIAGILLLFLATIIDGAACRFRDAALLRARAAAAKPATKRSHQPPKSKRTGKGIFTGVLSGIFMGFVYPIARNHLVGELALGPYAAILMFAIGMVISTIIFNFYFVNISIEGVPVSFSAYFRGKPGQHFLGFASGAMLVLGFLAALLAAATPPAAGINRALLVAIPGASVILGVLWGTCAWKEFARSSTNAKLTLSLGTLLFACGLALFAVAVGR